MTNHRPDGLRTRLIVCTKHIKISEFISWRPGDVVGTFAKQNSGGWLDLNGASYKKSEYPDLYAALSGDGGSDANFDCECEDAEFFRVPNMRDYVLKTHQAG